MTEVDSELRNAASGPSTGRTPTEAGLQGGVKPPGPKLSVDRIVDAAIALACRDGVAGVSMARLAAQLGSGTMSLYRHVASREELLAVMVDRALGPPAPPPPDQSWRQALTGWAEQLRDVLSRHPWVLQIPIPGPPQLPNDLRHLEVALDALAQTGLSEHDKFSTIVLISGFVRHDTTLRQSVTQRGATAAPTYAATLAARLDPVEFPRLQQALNADALDKDGVHEHFAFGLKLILDGLQIRIDQITQTKTCAPSTPPTRSRAKTLW